MSWLSGFFELADGAYKVLGVLTLLFGGAWSLIVWANRRAAQRERELKTEILKENEPEKTRLAAVEADLNALKGEVEDLDTRVETGFRSVDTKMAGLNRALATVARQSDVADLRSDVSGMNALLQRVSRMTDMQYEATLRREEGARK